MIRYLEACTPILVIVAIVLWILIGQSLYRYINKPENQELLKEDKPSVYLDYICFIAIAFFYPIIIMEMKKNKRNSKKQK